MSVDILLPTYRGGAYLEELYFSILKQSFTDWSLYCRDDASDDKSSYINQSFSNSYSSKIFCVNDHSGRLGASQSFSKLLTEPTSDYIMFCDQDDVWLPDKIEVTMKKFAEIEGGDHVPVLVHTDAKVVNESLKIIHPSFWNYQNIQPTRRETFNRLLVQNVVTGSTVMINKCLRDLAMPIPKEAVMHDWWLALVAAAFGRIGHVEQPTMLYRQHGTNVIGAKGWGRAFVMQRLAGDKGSVKIGLAQAQMQAKAFLERFHDQLPDKIRRTVESYAFMDTRSFLEKRYRLVKHRLFKAGLIRNLGMWFHI